MSRITSHQRRANDRRRYWSGYPAMVARRGGSRPGWDFTPEQHERFLRELYRAEKRYDRDVKAWERKGLPRTKRAERRRR